MLETAHIRKQIDREIFDYQQLTTCLAPFKKPRDKIGRLLARGEIVRVKKGLYVFGELFQQHPISRELLANLIYGPSYVSLDYALSYHGLIPDRVDAVTSVTPGRSRAFATPFGLFSYRGIGENRYTEGVVLEESGDTPFLIASPEKALVDKVWTDHRFSGARLLDFEPYLFDDLRLEAIRLTDLDGQRLAAIARAYDSPKIHRLVRYLQKLEKKLHA
jgi:hypothetical protein